MCNFPASPILAEKLHTRRPNPCAVLSLEPQFHAVDSSKAPGGKAFSHASNGEAGEKAFPPGADGGIEQKCLNPSGADGRNEWGVFSPAPLTPAGVPRAQPDEPLQLAGYPAVPQQRFDARLTAPEFSK